MEESDMLRRQGTAQWRSAGPGLDDAGDAKQANGSEDGSLRQLGGIGMLQRHAADFNLTDEQLDKLEAMQVQCELEKVDLLAALRKAKIRFRAKIRLEDAPEAEVIAAIDEVARCEAELRKMRYRHLQAGRKVLKPDQRGKVKTFRRKRQLEKAKQWREARPATVAPSTP
jgi:Spy/CpxP family protein refolding chaperone